MLEHVGGAREAGFGVTALDDDSALDVRVCVFGRGSDATLKRVLRSVTVKRYLPVTKCLFGVKDRRESFVVYDDLFRRCARDLAAFGRNGRNVLTDEENSALRQHRPVRNRSAEEAVRYVVTG
jgi:hypothetical protein